MSGDSTLQIKTLQPQPRTAEALNQLVFDALRPLCLGLTIIFPLVLGLHAGLDSLAARDVVVFLLSTSVAGVLYWARRTHRFTARWANPVATLVWVHTMTALVLTDTNYIGPIHLSYATVLLIAAGAFFLSWGWLTTCLTLVTAIWLTSRFLGEAEVMPHQLFVAGVSAWLAAMLLLATRRRTQLRLVELLRQEHLQRDQIQQAMEATERQKHFAEAVIDAAPAMVLVLTPDGDISRVNHYLEARTGYRREELVGSDWFETFFAAIDRVSARAAFVNILKSNSTDAAVCPVLTRDGKSIEIEWHYSVLRNERNLVEAVLVVGQDVHVDQLLQQKLMRSDRMATLGMLAAGVGHEINSPLSFVLLNSDILARELPAVLEEANRDPADRERLLTYVRDVGEGAKRIRDIVRDLKTYSKPSEHEGVGERVDFSGAVRSAVKLSTLETKYRCRTELDLPELPWVLGDEGKIVQVFVNLIVNAAQALRSTDPSRATIAVRLWEDGRLACAEVVDNGPGIKPADLQHIFEPFFTTKVASGGSGLGLAICRNIITSFGGTLEVESEVERGTRCVIRLPFAEEEEQPHTDSLLGEVDSSPV